MKKNVIAVILSIVMAVGSIGTAVPVFAAEEGSTTEAVVEDKEEEVPEDVSEEDDSGENTEDAWQSDSDTVESDAGDDGNASIEDDISDNGSDQVSDDKNPTSETEEESVPDTEMQDEDAAEESSDMASPAGAVASGTCGNFGDNLTWVLDDEGTLTISGTGKMKSYESGSAPWYSYKTQIVAIVISNGVTGIGAWAFSGCSSLTSVTIPDSVTGISGMAFQYCSSLTNLTLPDGVKGIGIYAFQGCSSLESVIIPDSVSLIYNNAFEDCSSLTSVTIPDSVTSIQDYVFEGCSSLEKVTIGNSVTSIGRGAFKDCSSLTSVTIPNSVTSTGMEAFSGCSSLEKVTIGNSVTSIGSQAFLNCSSLTSINVVSDNSNYASVDGVLLSKNNENLIQYPIGKSESNYTIPDNVTNIEAFAFYNCCNLTSVMISDSVTSIGFYSFYNCTNLTSVTIPDSVTSIEDYAFWKCSSLTGITIPDSVTRIGSAAFEGCNMLIVYSSNDVVFSYCRNYSIKCCPYIEKLSPEPYTEDVDINSTELVFYADFMCNIAYNDGFAYLFEVGIDNTPVDEIFLGEPDEGKCSIENGNRLILHFSLDKLKKGKNYYIRIEENAIKLLDQNKSYPGLAKDIWTFSIGGLFAVKEFYPEPGAENVDYNSDSPLFYINFAEKIDSNNGYAYLYEVGNNTPIETIYIGEDDDVRYGIFNEHRLVLNFSPASKRTLQQGKSYYITIDEGAIKFIDDEYNELDMHFPGIDKNVWTFSTINLDYFCFINPISEIVDERFYKDLFGPIRWENVKENGNNGSKGLCFGLNYVVGLNMIQADSIKSCLNSAEKKLSDFKTIKDLDGCKASDSQYSLLDYVKQAFIYQYTSSKNNEGRHNENQYTSLYNAIDTNLSSKPICIGILTDGEDEAVGHSLFPIEILKETDEYCDVLVYDSNGTEVSWKDCFGKTQRMHTFLHTLRLWKSKGDITGAEYDGSACTKINYVSVDSRFNLDVTKDIYNIVSSTFRLIERTPSVDLQPLFVTSGSEPVSSVNRYLYWTEAKILELNLTDTNTVSLAGVDDEIEITANAGATVRLDIENNTAKIDNIDASSEDYTITHTHAEDYDNIKSVVISGETSSTVNTESTDSGIIVSNEDNTPIEAVISVIDNDEEVTTVDITAITNTVNVICDENNQIEVLEDTDSDGTYETVVATTDCKSIRNAEITGIVDKQYTGSAIEQSISVAYDGTELNEGTDYTVAYENNINSGTASVIITGIGDYTGTITKTFTIEKAVQQITVSDLSLTFPGSGTISVSGNEGNLTYESDNTAIVEVDASGNLTAKGVGTASITITAEATDYYLEATKTITVTVCKSQDYLFFDKTAPTINKIVSYNGSDIRVYIEKRENASGYQIKYADNSSMTGAKTVMIKDNKTLSKVITGFKNNKTYYVKLQTYQKIGDKTYWSRWSAAKSIKITQTPYPTNVSKLSTFIGSHIKVDWTKTAGASGYHIKYADNSKMTGAKEVMVKGNSTFTKTLTGLKNGKTYYIKIQTYRTVSGKTYWSSWSPAKSIKVDQKPYGSSISKLTNPSSKAMKITWDKASSASGYHIQYATSSSMTGAKNITVNNKDTLSKTVTGLTKGKTYYVRIQTFRKVSGKTYWSSWSKAKQIKISK